MLQRAFEYEIEVLQVEGFQVVGGAALVLLKARPVEWDKEDEVRGGWVGKVLNQPMQRNGHHRCQH